MSDVAKLSKLQEVRKARGLNWSIVGHFINEHGAEMAMYSSDHHFDVLVIRRHKSDNAFIGAKAGDPVYPSKEQWGSLAWTFMGFDSALQKMKSYKPATNKQNQ